MLAGWLLVFLQRMSKLLALCVRKQSAWWTLNKSLDVICVFAFACFHAKGTNEYERYFYIHTRVPIKSSTELNSRRSETQQQWFLCDFSWWEPCITGADAASLLMLCTNSAWHGPLMSIRHLTASSGTTMATIVKGHFLHDKHNCSKVANSC